MVPELRQAYNTAFTDEKFQAFVQALNNYSTPIQFRIAETPVFIPQTFSQQMIDACEQIVDVILQPDFKEKTTRAIPENYRVPNENAHPHFIAFDFGICRNANGGLEPQLIEMQGFPTLFGYQVLLDDVFSEHFGIPPGYSSYLGGLNRQSYLELFKKIVVGHEDPENVILLEIFPQQQKTNVDFYCTEDYLGIRMVCVTELIRKGDQLFYLKDGVATRIKRIYNRVIFDELQQQEAAVQEKAAVLFKDLDVEWVTHPNWFYRISKFTLPLIQHPNIPETRFLSDIKEIPVALDHYVLKPLFSFAGQGVVIDVTPADIAAIKDPENWILQKKVEYASVIQTPDEPAKAEIRIFYFWEEGAARPRPVNNLARLSKGKMIGVRFNKDKTWTGGSFALFEQ
ncbi:hypothetical protein [Niabella drilacis]|uniref:Circularly permuted ATP-grasp type 2 n=1 Tax=Niabella drilacis (strain DSM 25811 / CCM 8410 / CCUG 62505 / LMG 26954 / E90) TaxID=1285928 RepID=A0A1G6WFN9_NIADE|nr:hypothetical protein [Niabella drilacis]SDD64760.1 hypothetical protein SAMN04487894_111117 [Niabella drilacis]